MTTNISYLAALKNLHPLWRISMLERANGADDEEVKDIQRQAKEKCITEASLLIQRLDFPGMESEWAQSNFAGHIAKLLSDDWAEIGGRALQKSYAEHLAGLASEAMYAGLPSSWHNSAAEVSYVATALNSISNVMSEYQTFNLFHYDQQKIQNFFEETIITQAQRCAAEVLEQNPMIKGDDSFSSLFQSFIKHSGIALADIWRSESTKFINEYNTADAQQKMIMQSKGADLSELAARHDKSMSAMLSMAMRTLSTAMNGLPESSLSSGSQSKQSTTGMHHE